MKRRRRDKTELRHLLLGNSRTNSTSMCARYKTGKVLGRLEMGTARGKMMEMLLVCRFRRQRLWRSNRHPDCDIDRGDEHGFPKRLKQIGHRSCSDAFFFGAELVKSRDNNRGDLIPARALRRIYSSSSSDAAKNLIRFTTSSRWLPRLRATLLPVSGREQFPDRCLILIDFFAVGCDGGYHQP